MKMLTAETTAGSVDRRLAPYSDGENGLARHGHTVSPPSPAPDCIGDDDGDDDMQRQQINDDSSHR